MAVVKQDERETAPVPFPSGHDRFGVTYQRSMSMSSRIQYFSIEDSAQGLSFQDCHAMSRVIAEALNSQAKSGLFSGGGRKPVGSDDDGS